MCFRFAKKTESSDLSLSTRGSIGATGGNKCITPYMWKLMNTELFVTKVRKHNCNGSGRDKERNCLFVDRQLIVNEFDSCVFCDTWYDLHKKLNGLDQGTWNGTRQNCFVHFPVKHVLDAYLEHQAASYRRSEGVCFQAAWVMLARYYWCQLGLGCYFIAVKRPTASRIQNCTRFEEVVPTTCCIRFATKIIQSRRIALKKFVSQCRW